MVPTARLELAQPKSLPPQDSVSTNSTTSAKAFEHLEWQRDEPAMNHLRLLHLPLLLYCGISRALEPASGPEAG